MMFFYGLSYKEVMELTVDTFQELYQAITIIEAEQALLAMNIAAYPHLKKEAQDKFRRQMHKLSRPKLFGDDNKKEVSMTDTAKILGGILNGR